MFPIERSRLSSYSEIQSGFQDAGYGSECVGESATPKWLSVLFWVGLALFLLSIVALIFVPWQQVSVGEGNVISYAAGNRGQRIESPVLGRIQKWLVQEGESVRKGQQLVQLADFDEKILSRLAQQREAAELRLKAAEQAVTVGESNIERQNLLLKKGLSSKRDVELAQVELSKYRAELSSAQSQLAELKVKISRQASQAVKAPFDGIVVRILVPDGGAVVQAAEPLALVVPETKDRAVELTISGIDLPLVSPGRKVRLQFEGWPAVQFTGWPSVAVGTFGGVVEVVDAIDDGKGNYRILVFPDKNDEPWPEDRYLRQGVRAIGWILLDEVTLGWEVWRQLNSFPMTVDDSPVEAKPKMLEK